MYVKGGQAFVGPAGVQAIVDGLTAYVENVCLFVFMIFCKLIIFNF